MGYLRGVMHGALIGGVVALLYAPKAGRETRTDLSERLNQVRGQVQPVLDQAQEIVETARPQVERTISKAQQRVTGKGASASSSGYAGPSGIETGTGAAPGV